MKHADFRVGIEFVTSTGQKWRCTDVGQRTITAIEIKTGLKEEWFQGPPYALPEVVFDERDMAGAYTSLKKSILDAFDDVRESGHPGFSTDIVKRMFSIETRQNTSGYPRASLLRYDRLSRDKEILHPFGARRNENGGWTIEVYHLFEGAFSEVPENDFVSLPIAAPADIKARAESIRTA